ncbi:MAG TPA: 23S rRNA (cytidine(2498)-2'-O)-methyltransferase RlmM [Usitatibacteraceae bacterium]|nr:23S rRNA (cytidine(2498)-2'-O)-methyltransferase RlmM [Usitatibacteraceae bacterium]
MSAANLLAYCRAGFEKECAQEMTALAGEAGVEGFVKARPDSAFAVFHPHDATAGLGFARRLDATALVFPRQVVRCGEMLADLPVGDRVAPIVSAAAALGTSFRETFLETPDTNDGKALASLIRPLEPHLLRALPKAGIAIDDPKAAGRLHVFFLGGAACYVGTSRVGASCPWPMGIARIRMPGGAPSRSTLKLAEALALFIGEEALARRMRPGMTAVDLGASPGGWTWQLVRRGLMVTAIDNGPMDAALMESGQVKHRREDGFRYRPPEPVDWMVCDMVESPSRVCTLAAQWVAEGWCREAIFNLKLPMKKRWEEVARARGIIEEALAGVAYRLRMKHLYHDREEITVWLAAGKR